MPHALHPHPPLRRRALCAWALALALAAGPAAAQEAATGRIVGQIRGASADDSVAGTRVVLVRFRLDAEGQPEGRPIQSHTVGEDGRYSFTDVPVDTHSVYQIGAVLEGRMVGSDAFTFPGRQREVKIDLRLPRISGDASGVVIQEGLIAVEPRRGAVAVTEVLHLANPSGSVIVREDTPLELSIPAAAERLEMLRELRSEDGHERLGGKLLVYGDLPPGRATVAFRYRLAAPWGSVSLDKHYPRPLGVLSILAPAGSLELDGAGFESRGTRRIEDTRYDTWAREGIAADMPLQVRLSGVPTRQEQYLVLLAVFLVAMAGVVAWFVRRRLGASAPGKD